MELVLHLWILIQYQDLTKVTATYENTTVESSIIVNQTILANDIVKFYRNDTHFVAKFTDSNGTALKDNNTTVKFNINGVFYKANITNGTATLRIWLNPENMFLTAFNSVTGEEQGFKKLLYFHQL